MFDRLTESLSGAFRRLSGKGTITEANVREALDDVRRALLEADVHLEVVDDFCRAVLDDALGRRVTASLKPGQEFIGIVHQRLVDLLGGADQEEAGVLRVSPGPTVVMMCGLQGSGKTTTCGKLAAWLKKRGRSVMLAAADLQRPAAVEQLQTIAQQVEAIPGGARTAFYAEPDKVAEYGKATGVAVAVCRRALDAARRDGFDTLILDTAGRLHVNDDLMDELRRINATLQPHQIFLVVDAMTGQDAVNSARAFHQQLEVDGVILTKFDSDTRGGAALSVRKVTGAPIRFVGVGERLDALEPFHPQRFAGRILGMGDVVSLVEKAREEVSEEEARLLEEKLARGEMTMDDFLKQLHSLRRMGPLKQILGLLPGVGQALKDAQIDDKQLDRIEAIINSMTRQERAKPSILTPSRRRRIARGSGTDQSEVARLVKQFETVSRLSRSMASMSAAQKVRAVRELGAGGMGELVPGAGRLPGLSTRKPTKGVSRGFKQRKKRR